MDAETTSRRSLFGLAGLVSLCCLAPSAIAVTRGVAVGGGGIAAGVGADLAQILVTVLTLAVAGVVVKRRTSDACCSR